MTTTMENSAVYEPASVSDAFVPIMKAWYLAYYFGGLLSILIVIFEFIAVILYPRVCAPLFPPLVIAVSLILGTSFCLVRSLKAPKPPGPEETPPLKRVKVHFWALLLFGIVWIGFAVAFILESVGIRWNDAAQGLSITSCVLAFLVSGTYILAALSLKRLAKKPTPPTVPTQDTVEGGFNRPSAAAQGLVNAKNGAIRI